MELTLSTGSPLNSLYSTKDGRVGFRVETKLASSSKASARITKISCAVPSCAGHGTDEHRNPLDAIGGHEFTHIADVEYDLCSPSVFRYQGQEVNAENYFREGMWGECGRHRVFAGPDRREYRWLISTCTPELVTNDKSRTLVARFSQSDYKSVKEPRMTSLTIFPPGEVMVETILMTLLYIELEKKQSKKGMGRILARRKYLLQNGINPKSRSVGRKGSTGRIPIQS